MSAVAIKDGEVREVIRSRQSTRFATGLRWCPWCDHSSQLDRGVCRGCGAIFEENYEAPTEEPESSSKCTCQHGQNHHNDEGQCRYRQHCNCEGFTLAVIVP